MNEFQVFCCDVATLRREQVQQTLWILLLLNARHHNIALSCCPLSCIDHRSAPIPPPPAGRIGNMDVHTITLVQTIHIGTEHITTVLYCTVPLFVS